MPCFYRDQNIKSSFFKFLVPLGESVSYFLCTLADSPSYTQVHMPVALKISRSYWTLTFGRETQHCPYPLQVRHSMNNTV